MTEQELIDSGYKKYTGGAALFKQTDYYYAKMFCDEKGKKYQIIFYHYSWEEYDGIGTRYESFEPEVQFRGDDFYVDIMLHSVLEQSVLDVEAYYEAQWMHHGKPYYELFDRN